MENKNHMVDFVELTPVTCSMNDAYIGFACNKTVFLLQKYLQSPGQKYRTWTVKYYGNDRFGLLNGILYLMEESAIGIEVYFSEKKIGTTGFTFFDKKMSFVEVSKTIDKLYDFGQSIVIYA